VTTSGKVEKKKKQVNNLCKFINDSNNTQEVGEKRGFPGQTTPMRRKERYRASVYGNRKEGGERGRND